MACLHHPGCVTQGSEDEEDPYDMGPIGTSSAAAASSTDRAEVILSGIKNFNASLFTCSTVRTLHEHLACALTRTQHRQSATVH